MHPAAWELYITRTWSHFSWLKGVISSHSKRFKYGLPPFFENQQVTYTRKKSPKVSYFFKSPFWCWSVDSVIDSWTKGQSIPKSQANGLSPLLGYPGSLFASPTNLSPPQQQWHLLTIRKENPPKSDRTFEKQDLISAYCICCNGKNPNKKQVKQTYPWNCKQRTFLPRSMRSLGTATFNSF